MSSIFTLLWNWSPDPCRTETLYSLNNSSSLLCSPSPWQLSFYFLYLLMPFLYFLFLLISAAVFCLVIPFRSCRLVILTSLVSNLLFNLLNFFFTTLSTCYLHRLYHTYSKCAFWPALTYVCVCLSMSSSLVRMSSMPVAQPHILSSSFVALSCSSCPPSQETARIVCYHRLVCIFYNFM